MSCCQVNLRGELKAISGAGDAFHDTVRDYHDPVIKSGVLHGNILKFHIKFCRLGLQVLDAAA